MPLQGQGMGEKNPHPEHAEKTLLIVPAPCPAENPPYGFWDTTPTIENTGENYHNAAKSVNPFELCSETFQKPSAQAYALKKIALFRSSMRER